MSHDRPLCPDGYSGFVRHDPKGKSYNEVLPFPFSLSLEEEIVIIVIIIMIYSYF